MAFFHDVDRGKRRGFPRSTAQRSRLPRDWIHGLPAVGVVLLAIAMACAGRVRGADAPADAALAAREAELLARYRDLERSFLRLADLLAATDPRRAAVLRAAFDRAREEQVGDRVASIVKLLEQGQLLKAGTSQQDAIVQLRALLDLLETGTGERGFADTKRRGPRVPRSAFQADRAAARHRGFDRGRFGRGRPRGAAACRGRGDAATRRRRRGLRPAGRRR